MVVVMSKDATEADIDRVAEKVREVMAAVRSAH